MNTRRAYVCYLGRTFRILAMQERGERGAPGAWAVAVEELAPDGSTMACGPAGASHDTADMAIVATAEALTALLDAREGRMSTDDRRRLALWGRDQRS